MLIPELLVLIFWALIQRFDRDDNQGRLSALAQCALVCKGWNESLNGPASLDLWRRCLVYYKASLKRKKLATKLWHAWDNGEELKGIIINKQIELSNTCDFKEQLKVLGTKQRCKKSLKDAWKVIEGTERYQMNERLFGGLKMSVDQVPACTLPTPVIHFPVPSWAFRQGSELSDIINDFNKKLFRCFLKLCAPSTGSLSGEKEVEKEVGEEWDSVQMVDYKHTCYEFSPEKVKGGVESAFKVGEAYWRSGPSTWQYKTVWGQTHSPWFWWDQLMFINKRTWEWGVYMWPDIYYISVFGDKLLSLMASSEEYRPIILNQALPPSLSEWQALQTPPQQPQQPQHQESVREVRVRFVKNKLKAPSPVLVRWRFFRGSPQPHDVIALLWKPNGEGDCRQSSKKYCSMIYTMSLQEYEPQWVYQYNSYEHDPDDEEEDAEPSEFEKAMQERGLYGPGEKQLLHLHRMHDPKSNSGYGWLQSPFKIYSAESLKGGIIEAVYLCPAEGAEFTASRQWMLPLGEFTGDCPEGWRILARAEEVLVLEDSEMEDFASMIDPWLLEHRERKAHAEEMKACCVGMTVTATKNSDEVTITIKLQQPLPSSLEPKWRADKIDELDPSPLRETENEENEEGWVREDPLTYTMGLWVDPVWAPHSFHFLISVYGTPLGRSNTIAMRAHWHHEGFLEEYSKLDTIHFDYSS